MDPFKLEYNQKDVPMPRFGKTALELLDSKDDEPKSLFNIYGIRLYGGAVGLAMHAGTNWVFRRPMRAGIHMYAVWFAAGATVTHVVEKWRQGIAAERDAVMRHYIQTHPEDFIPPPRVKFADVLNDWIPVR